MRRDLVMLVVLVCAAPAAAQPTADDRQRAKAAFDQGSSEYLAGHYDRAIDRFQEAYRLSHAPSLLFNIAQAYRLKGTGFCAQALQYYRRSVDEEPDAENRVEIDERIREMDACARAAVAPTPPSPITSAPSPPTTAAAEPAKPAKIDTAERDQPHRRRSLAPLITAGAGAVTALTGAIIYWRARVKFDEVEPTCPCAPGSFSGWETATTASYVLIGAGAAAAAGGLVWYAVTRRGHAPALGLAPTPGGIQYTARF